MIYYFSGTGNSRWVAEHLADLLGDQTQDILKWEERPDAGDAQQIGLVFPVYAWGPAEPMLEFARKLGKTQAFTFGICTCGSDAGHTMKKLAEVFPLNSSYSIAMPNNYVIGSELEQADVVREKLVLAAQQLQTIAGEIAARTPVYRVREGALPALKSSVVNMGFNRFARSIKGFFATQDCVGCGWCAQNCPAHAITMNEGKPVWAGKCYQCMRCIHGCPEAAIQYGKATRLRKRYHLQDYL